MKCETCTEYLTQFEYDCFNGICDKCHENFVKDEIAFKLKETKENDNKNS